MKGIRAAHLVLFGLGLAGLPTAAPAADSAITPVQCHLTSCVTTTVTPSAGGWHVQFEVQESGALDYEVFNLRVLGNEQLELKMPHDIADVEVPRGWDGNFLLQACNTDGVFGSNCDTWTTFRAELVTSDDRNFCVRYAGHAVSEALTAQQNNCSFDAAPAGRWSTDNTAHLNWCLGQFLGAGGDVNGQANARNLANSEDATRVAGLQSCQADAAASAKAYADERASETQVTGRSVAQCAQSNQLCEARRLGRLGPLSAPPMIAAECTPFFQQCVANAAASEKAFADERASEMQITGRSAGECAQSNQICEARRIARFGPVTSPAMIATECAPFFQQCIANAAAAEAAASTEDTAETPTEDTGDEMADTDTSGGMTDDTSAPLMTGRVKRGVNVHFGNVKGDVLGSLPAGTTIEIFDCDKSACRIPFEGDEGFVSTSFLDLGGGGGTSGGFRVEIPLPGKNKVVITTPGAKGFAGAPPVASFAGVWDTRSDKDWNYVITLNQKGKKVSGGYVAQDGSKGTIDGIVAANVLDFKWTADGGYVGTGRFQMTDEGVMDGNYDTTKFPDPDMDDYYKTGSWHAERR